MRVGTFIVALLLVVTGVTAFMINIGYGSWVFWQTLGKLWPVLLIILGLGLFWQGQIPRPVAYLLVVAAVAGVVTYLMLHNGSGFPI